MLRRLVLMMLVGCVFATVGLAQSRLTISFDETIPDEWNPAFRIGREFPHFLVERLRSAGFVVVKGEPGADAKLKCETSISIALHSNEPQRSNYECILESAGGKKLWRGGTSFVSMSDPILSDRKASEIVFEKLLKRLKNELKK